MAPKFCPACGSIMTIKKDDGKLVAICPVCGYKEVVDKTLPVSLLPADVEEELSVRKGVIKDKSIKKISIDEDTLKEALDQLNEAGED